MNDMWTAAGHTHGLPLATLNVKDSWTSSPPRHPDGPLDDVYTDLRHALDAATRVGHLSGPTAPAGRRGSDGSAGNVGALSGTLLRLGRRAATRSLPVRDLVPSSDYAKAIPAAEQAYETYLKETHQ